MNIEIHLKKKRDLIKWFNKRTPFPSLKVKFYDV